MTARAAWEKFYEKQPRPWAGAVEPVAIDPGARVLELGCGGGRILIPMLRGRPGPDVVGVDISRSSLASLSDECAGVLVLADAVRLPFRDRAFDVVLCRHVLEHMLEDGRRAAANEIMRVLKKGGTAFFEGFATRDARFGKGKDLERNTFLRGDGIFYHYFTTGEIGPMFAGAIKLDVREREWTERAGRTRMTRAVIAAEITK